MTFCFTGILSIAAYSQQKNYSSHSMNENEHSLTNILRKKEDMPREVFLVSVRQLLAKDDTSAVERQEASYILGRFFQNSSQDEEKKQALAMFSQSQKVSALRRLSQWHIVELAAVLGPEKLVRSTLTQLANEGKETQDKERIEYCLAQSYLRTNTVDKAEPLLKKIHTTAINSNYALGSAYYLGEMAISRTMASGHASKNITESHSLGISSDLKEGVSLFCQYLETSPVGHFAPVIIDRLTKLKITGEPLASMVQGALAYSYYSNSHWREALDLWSKVKAGTNRKLEICTCLAKLGLISQAEDALLKYIRLKPSDPDYVSVVDTICKSLSKTEAIALWQRILSAKPKALDVVLWNIAIRSKPPGSLQCYKELLSRYPSSPFAAESQWWLLWDACRHNTQRDLDPIINLAARSAQKFSHARAAPRFLFWAGKLSERKGQLKQAQSYYNQTVRLFPADYYGFRAADRLSILAGKQSIYTWDSPMPRHQSINWVWPLPADLVRRLNKIEEEPLWELLRLHQYDEALDFVSAKQPQLEAWLYVKLHQPAKTIASANKSLTGSPKFDTIWQYAFPLLYSQEINHNCQAAHNVDSNLMHALVRQESYYDARSLSPAGAIGLTQLLPSTAISIAKNLHLYYKGSEQLYDPGFNLKLGTQYVSTLLALFHNKALYAVASYNSGPAPISSLLSKPKCSDPDIFLETIPYSETRDYIRQVFRSFWIYNYIY